MKDRLLYFISGPKEWGLSTTYKERVGNHHFRIDMDGQVMVWPGEFSATAISLPEYKKIMTDLNARNWLFIDSLLGEDDIYSIKNHINRSGENFLRARTPFEDGVMFLDVSNIYTSVPGLPEKTVSTVGKERFRHKSNSDEQNWSLGVGLVTPLAHYLGIKVSAVGTIPSPEKTQKILSL